LLANTEQVGDCIVSCYSTGSHGYSQIGWYEPTARRSVMVLGHRAAWESANGPIPEGMTVDHMCRNRRCINVDHLRLLSNTDNARDNGMSRRTHCPSGHAYDETNTYVHPRTGHRSCRACASSKR
jgi:rhodanese-related sulfurtransferase